MAEYTPAGGGESELAGVFSGENAPYVEALFEDYLLGRARVPETWARIFDDLTGHSGSGDNGHPRPAAREETVPALGIYALINAYRTHGHLIARLDPLGRSEDHHPLLDPSEFGLDPAHMSQRVACPSFLGCAESTPEELIELLQETYCRTFAIEFMQMQNKERRDWLLEQTEPILNRPELVSEDRRRILTEVLAAERFERCLHRRFLGQKRFSIEGGDAFIPLLNVIVEDGAALGAKEIVLAMAHRGRLNVLAHVMGMPYRAIFRDFQATLMPPGAQGSGDVKYHRGYSSDRVTRQRETIHLSLCSNPSHLEWINPIAEGMVRAKQNYRGDTERKQVIPVLIHGDAAFNGQGIVPETLSLSELEHHWTGGTIHIVVNNQIGFTADPSDYRFTRYPSDMAKVIEAPVFHVNADDPEACVHAARLAIAFRQRFGEDVIIDLVCYRRHGHSEGDDPTFTQPVLYRKIAEHPTALEQYGERLIAEGVLDAGTREKITVEQDRILDEAFDESRTQLRLEGAESYHGLWEGFNVGNVSTERETQVPKDTLDRIAAALVDLPEDFRAHPKVRKLLVDRATALRGGDVDWGTAETAAIGSLLLEGTVVRMTGQDVERGTFSHRHVVLRDVETEERFIPLDALGEGETRLIIRNSMLSEAAVLGFEYGFSSVDPNRLTIWEAQYGDFSNCAQVIIDQFIASAEKKWHRSSAIVLLLPHGYEGQGPEHSSARIERFLQLCAEDNIQVCNASTPAQYFHVLRRQMCASFRKPLILMTPKSLLRHRRAVSPARALQSGQFHEVLDDPGRVAGTLDPGKTRRVLVCSGKVFYTLLEAREEGAFHDVGILRLEQLHPFPFETLRERVTAYSAHDVVWVQEEPWNMGAWSFVRDRIRRCLPEGAELRYVGRRESASPATGSYKLHLEEEQEFVQEAFALHARAPVR
ncbi:MAG: 2-oxoglutarate dehydrogenase E1 component [Myxococcota bacterium]